MTQNSPGNPDLGPSHRGRLQLGSSRGARAKHLEAEVTRDLNHSDMVILKSSPLGTQPQGIQRIRDSHHQLARTLAKGFSQVEASAMTGYSPSRISILSRDPAFKELLDFYRERHDSAEVDVIERLKTMSLDALQELHDRLLNQPEDFKNQELIDLVSRMLDRSGYGPMSKSQHTERRITLTGQDLRELHEATEESGNVIEGTAKDQSQASSSTSPAPRRLNSNEAEPASAVSRTSLPDGGGAGVDDAERGSSVWQAEKVEGEPRQGSNLRKEGGKGTEGSDQ
jgi:hypothetical protein